MSAVQLYQLGLVVEACWGGDGDRRDCGLRFAMDSDYARRAQLHGFTFHCPKGHRLRYGEGELETTKRLLEEEKQRRIRAEQGQVAAIGAAKTAQRASAITRGKLKAVKQRVSNGVCPCCNRTFQNLMRHMHTKHPDYQEQQL